MNENDNSRSMLDMLTHEQKTELFAWAEAQRPALGGSIDLMKWPGWIEHFRARLAALTGPDSEAQAGNENPLPAQDDCRRAPVAVDEYWRFGMHVTTVTQNFADLQRAYREAAPRGPLDHDGE